MRNCFLFVALIGLCAACGSAASTAAPTDATAAAADTKDAAGTDVAAPVVSWCEGPTAFRYAPAAGAALETFPDDYYTVADATSPTGLRVRFDPTLDPWIPATPENFQPIYADLSTLDGWGTTAGIILRFSAPLQDLPSGETSTASDDVQLLDLTGDKPVRVPFEVQYTDDASSAILWPMLPLRPGHRHAVVVKRTLLAKDGQCIAPSPTLRALLTGTSTQPRLQALHGRYAELLAKTGLSAGDISAAVVFTTQRITEQSTGIAKDIAGRKFAWKTPATCTVAAKYRVCNGTFIDQEYRDGRTVKDGQPVKEQELAVQLWLPLTGSGPWPTVIFGHGLGSNRSQAEALADVAAPENIATVAIDAVGHGDHPGPHGTNTLTSLLVFFGINAATASVDALALRDNWRASTYDKLQLIQLLKQAPDIDGDGKAEIDPSRILYLGVSLGGIMGSELLALSADLPVGILSVPGGRVSSIISDSAQFRPIIYALKPDGTTDSDVDRFFPALQTLLEKGDAANYGPYILKDRLPGAGAAIPDLLFQMVLNDDTVPNSANRALARALGVPVVAPVLTPVGIVQPAPAAPFSGNVAGGKATAGLFQFDRDLSQGSQVPTQATHGNVAKSQEGLLQSMHFVKTWLATGKAEILNPYAELGTPPLAKP